MDLLTAMTSSGLLPFHVHVWPSATSFWQEKDENTRTQRLPLSKNTQSKIIVLFCLNQLLLKQCIRKAPDTLNILRHVMRAILSVQPKCPHRCVSLKESPLKPVLILKHTTRISMEQTSMRTKWLIISRLKLFRSVP